MSPAVKRKRSRLAFLFFLSGLHPTSRTPGGGDRWGEGGRRFEASGQTDHCSGTGRQGFDLFHEVPRHCPAASPSLRPPVSAETTTSRPHAFAFMSSLKYWFSTTVKFRNRERKRPLRPGVRQFPAANPVPLSGGLGLNPSQTR